MTDTISIFPRPAPSTSEAARETGIALSGTQPGSVPLYRYAQGSSTGAEPVVIEIDKLYPATKGAFSDLARALGLLAEAIGLLQDAKTTLQNKDLIASDRSVQRFQAILPELFAPRKIGDGYAVIINSLHLAFVNQRGKPLSFDQLTTLWRILRELRNAPFVQFEQALLAVEEMEKCGLQVDAPIVSELLGDAEDDVEAE